MKSFLVSALILAPLVLMACGSKQDRTGENSKDVIDRVKLSPGEKKNYTIPTSAPVQIGLVVLNDSKDGPVTLKQVGQVSQVSASYTMWISREWVPENGNLVLELTNNAKNELEIVVFRGAKPPDWAVK